MKLNKLGRYTLHARPFEVVDAGRVVRLTKRQLDVLQVLVRAKGRIVAKEDFFRTIWADEPVEDGNLTQTIFLIRRALGKLPDGREFVETVPRRGYRIASGLLGKQPASSLGDTGADLNAWSTDVHFGLLLDAIEDYAIYMLDPGGRVRTWNTGAERSKGYSRDEVLGKHYSLFFVPEEIAKHVPERQLSAASRSGKFSGEGWRIRKNGDRFWASFVLTAMRSSSGKLLGFAKVVRDLTAGKQREDQLRVLEAAMRRERDRLYAAAESSMDAFFICESVRDVHGEIEDFSFTYLNKNVEKLVLIPRSRLLRGKMCELIPANRTLGVFDAYKRVVETGEPYVAEFPLQEEKVASEWIRVQAVRLDDGLAITASDITERMRTQEQLRMLLKSQK